VSGIHATVEGKSKVKHVPCLLSTTRQLGVPRAMLYRLTESIERFKLLILVNIANEFKPIPSWPRKVRSI
jgi:hypothetical protein